MFKRINVEIVPLTEDIKSGAVFSNSDPQEVDLAGAQPTSTPTQAENEDVSAKPEIRADQMHKTIFVVDDERTIADTLVAILQNSGFNALAFYDGESALTACERSAPENILSDVIMPGMSGIDLAMTVRERFPDCRVLLFSGNAGTLDLVEHAHKSGYDFEVLLKPVHPRDLLARLSAPGNMRTAPPLTPMSGNRQLV